jgi:hypothetical protein
MIFEPLFDGASFLDQGLIFPRRARWAAPVAGFSIR